MAAIRVLASWIGDTDLRVMSVDQSKSIRDKIEKEIGLGGRPPVGSGPVKTLLANESFDEILLLCNRSSHLTNAYVRWLNVPGVVARQVPLSNPTAYGEVYTKVDEALREFLGGFKQNPFDLSILLSPGTPAMTAIWVLLGKSRYPATFYQTFRGSATKEDIPFDLVVDFVPELLRGPDTGLQKMAARSPQDVKGFESIIGESKAIRLAVGRAERAALRNVPVLLLGESGTGKELFARAIHAASPRKTGPFEVLNCAAIPQQLLESELFGHVKGAFTGATTAHKGAFERADGGTLFLDEIGELASDVQAKLLRVLQPMKGQGPSVREYHPVGSEKPRRSDVRLVAATNRDLLGAVSAGRFRDDLYYRLAVITIKLPPLRQRRSDIPALAKALLDQINTDFSKGEPGYMNKKISGSTISFVEKHDWPGNVRELYNALLQAAVMTDGDQIHADDIKAAIAEMPIARAAGDLLEFPLGDGFSIDEHLESIQKHYLRRAMQEANGVLAQAARLLGIEKYQTLSAQLKRLGVEWES